ncbi:MAG: hypothetical protein PHD31_01435, partial [Candidatus Pacebacteria bacterium]|nr:hypothetical protein [Candidatus Paceibacterota bacterium]
YAVFILATTEAYKMIPTIASRCQRFDFYRLPTKEIIEKLENICKKENVEIEKDALTLIASASEGSMRDAEGTLNQVLSFLPGTKIKIEDIQALLGLIDMKLVVGMSNLIIEKDKAKALRFLSDNLEKGLDIDEFTKSLIDYLRKLLILKIDSDLIDTVMPGETKELVETAQKQAEKFSENDLKKTLNLLIEAENKSKYASIQQLPLELALIESIGIE